MITIEDINIEEWADYRLLDYKPKHFIVTHTPVNDTSKIWIREKLKGRYCFIDKEETTTFLFLGMEEKLPCFEDPKEAIFYELTWS